MIETLTLPEPARSLWLEKRDIIRSLPGESGKRPGRAHLCGGTILAARLGHRLSTDIDLLFTDRESLIDLCQGDENDIVELLQGEPERIDGRHIRVSFGTGSIDLTVLRPIPPEGQHEAVVEGRREMVLTNMQILAGKLERAEAVLVRDVVDVLVAAERDRAALAGAVSLLPQTSAAAIAHAWRSANEDLADELPTEIHELDPSIRLDPTRLGGDAADALLAHRYRRVAIDVGEKELAIAKTIAGGPLPTERYATSDAARAIVASGISGYLNSHGPVSGAALIAQVCESRGKRRKWSFDTGTPRGGGASP
ncbi:MAG: nucleotidyl transferase AbiEii/AbiGii toxin family protein [Acidobacteria bacterium]|nr:nucleotidyl transferase AbiEii/AbiGii toxin family protein [Acidobacteriota bacterium]